MTDDDYKELERLLDKLGGELKILNYGSIGSLKRHFDGQRIRFA